MPPAPAANVAVRGCAIEPLNDPATLTHPSTASEAPHLPATDARVVAYGVDFGVSIGLLFLTIVSFSGQPGALVLLLTLACLSLTGYSPGKFLAGIRVFGVGATPVSGWRLIARFVIVPGPQWLLLCLLTPEPLAAVVASIALPLYLALFVAGVICITRTDRAPHDFLLGTAVLTDRVLRVRSRRGFDVLVRQSTDAPPPELPIDQNNRTAAQADTAPTQSPRQLAHIGDRCAAFMVDTCVALVLGFLTRLLTGMSDVLQTSSIAAAIAILIIPPLCGLGGATPGMLLMSLRRRDRHQHKASVGRMALAGIFPWAPYLYLSLRLAGDSALQQYDLPFAILWTSGAVASAVLTITTGRALHDRLSGTIVEALPSALLTG